MFIYVKDTPEQRKARRRFRNRSPRRVVHTTTSFASAGVYLCGCGLKARVDDVKDFESVAGRVSNSFDMDRAGGVECIDQMSCWEWCPGCREDYMTEVTAEILAGKR
jgi:hypothetical protein